MNKHKRIAITAVSIILSILVAIFSIDLRLIDGDGAINLINAKYLISKGQYSDFWTINPSPIIYDHPGTSILLSPIFLFTNSLPESAIYGKIVFYTLYIYPI